MFQSFFELHMVDLALSETLLRGCDLFVFSGDKIKRKDSFWKIVE